MNELIKVNEETMTVSARELHEKLNIATRFNDWFPRMCAYGFTEGIDFYTKKSKTTEVGGRPATDYDVTIAMAKEICMIQRTEIGKQVRQYFINIEKAWNTPEMAMARGLKAAQLLISQKDEQIKLLEADNSRMKPKEIFADAVSASDTSILIRDFAKILRQNGVDMGEKRLYKWLRENGYIIKGTTQPTQRAMEMGLFEVIERSVQRSDMSPIVTMTTKITGKGQQYFINKFLAA
jgi:anti-repressor protein